MKAIPMPGSWTEVTLAGKSVDFFTPEKIDGPRRAVVHLHGHSGQTLKDNAVFSQELEKQGLMCFCPHGARSWWGWRVCPEFDPQVSPGEYLVKQLLPELESRYQLTPPAIGLTGISMGGQGALRIAYRYPRLFPVVAVLAPAVDFQQWHGRGLPLDAMYPTAESARQETATLEIHPLNWPRHQWIACDPTDHEWIDGVERLLSKLNSIGIPHIADIQTSHGGHAWEYFEWMAPRLMSYVAEKLQEESLRLEAEAV